jgi:hypothetical protein
VLIFAHVRNTICSLWNTQTTNFTYNVTVLAFISQKTSKTYRRLVLDIKFAFNFSLQVSLETFFTAINISGIIFEIRSKRLLYLRIKFLVFWFATLRNTKFNENLFSSFVGFLTQADCRTELSPWERRAVEAIGRYPTWWWNSFNSF